MHDTKSLYSKIFELDHGFKKQVAVAGSGRGEHAIIEGHPQVHKVVLELLKFDIVWRVIVDDGYFMVTVSEPTRWKEIIGEVQQTLVRLENDKTKKD